jgi:hypothetical protein
MSAFEKWWDSTNNANYFHDGATADGVKRIAYEAFRAGAFHCNSLAEREETNRVRCEAGGMTPLPDKPEKIKVTVKDGFAILEDKDLMAIANRIRSQFEGWRKGVQPVPTDQKEPVEPGVLVRFKQNGMEFEKRWTPEKKWHWARLNPPPEDSKPVILDTMVMRVDKDGCAVLSDKDVTRIAEATVKHAYAIRAEAARARLQQQQQQMREEAKAREIIEIACGIRSPETPALEALKRKAVRDRLDMAVRDSEAAIANALTASTECAFTYVKFEHVIAALRNLVAAVKILKEQV